MYAFVAPAVFYVWSILSALNVDPVRIVPNLVSLNFVRCTNSIPLLQYKDLLITMLGKFCGFIYLSTSNAHLWFKRV